MDPGALIEAISILWLVTRKKPCGGKRGIALFSWRSGLTFDFSCNVVYCMSDEVQLK